MEAGEGEPLPSLACLNLCQVTIDGAVDKRVLHEKQSTQTQTQAQTTSLSLTHTHIHMHTHTHTPQSPRGSAESCLDRRAWICG